MSALIRYDAMCRAIDAAYEVDAIAEAERRTIGVLLRLTRLTLRSL